MIYCVSSRCFDTYTTTHQSSQVHPAVHTMVAVIITALRPPPARSALVDLVTSSIATVALVLVGMYKETLHEWIVVKLMHDVMY